MWRQIKWLALHALPPVAAVMIGMWAIQDSPPTKVFVLEVVPRVVKPGETITVRFQGIRNRACPVISNETIIDGDGHQHPVQSRLGNPQRIAGMFDVQFQVQVPNDVAEGFATYRSIASYGVDLLRGCFRTWIIGPPERPDARFWIGDSPPWRNRRSQ